MTKVKKFLRSYWMLFFLWLGIGLVTLISGEISRVAYACPWFLLLMEYAAKGVTEEHFPVEEQKNT